MKEISMNEIRTYIDNVVAASTTMQRFFGLLESRNKTCHCITKTILEVEVTHHKEDYIQIHLNTPEDGVTCAIDISRPDIISVWRDEFEPLADYNDLSKAVDMTIDLLTKVMEWGKSYCMIEDKEYFIEAQEEDRESVERAFGWPPR